MGFIKANWLQLAIIFAAIFIAYFGVWNFGFVYDDGPMLAQNQLIKNFTPLHKFFTEPGVFIGNSEDPQVWRPVSAFVKAVSWVLFGANPAGHHVFNLLLHLTNAGLFYVLLINFLKKKWPASPSSLGGPASPSSLGGPASLATLLFALHPVLTESVSWITSQNNLIWPLFFLLACLASQKGKVWWAVLFFALALLSKETALSGLPILLILFQWQKQEVGKKIGYPVAAMVLASTAYILIRWILLGLQDESRRTWLVAPAVFWKYVSLVFWPKNLIVHYSEWSNFPIPANVFDPRVIFGFLSFGLLIAAIIYFWKQGRRLEFLGLVWFLVFLLPVAQIIPFVDLIGERALYAPIMGLGLFLAAISKRWAHQKVFAVSCLFFILFFGISSFQRNQDWRNRQTLWESALRVDPQNHRAFTGLGYYYLVDNYNPQKSLEYSDRLLAIWPDHYLARVNRANALVELGEFALAERELLVIINEYPDPREAVKTLEYLQEKRS